MALVEGDTAGGGGRRGRRAGRQMRDHLGWPTSAARAQAARVRSKRLVERGWLSKERPGLYKPRPGRASRRVAGVAAHQAIVPNWKWHPVHIPGDVPGGGWQQATSYD